VDGEAGRGGLRFWLAAFWRQNWWGWSSFHRDPAKRAVLTLGDSPARCAFVPAASTVACVFVQDTMPTQQSFAGPHLPVTCPVHPRIIRATAKTGIRHNTKFYVLSRRRQAQPGLPPHPDAHITRNSSHKHEFHIISVLARPAGFEELSSTNNNDKNHQSRTGTSS